jgi:transposase-like protein
MSASAAPAVPPFCPNEHCPFHTGPTCSWRWVRNGSFRTHATPGRIQRYQCRHCRRHFSEQTFRASYWLKRPELLLTVAQRLVGCSGFRQIARELEVSPQTVLSLSARIGRHCLLFHEQHRPKGELSEPLALDGFVSFEWSQYHPTQFHTVVGQQSHYIHGFTDSEVRRSGTMRVGQRRKRARLEAKHGRPDPRSVEREVATLLRLVTAGATRLELHSDEHRDYPLALARQQHLKEVKHHTISSRALRDTRNPLFAINLLDLLIRHSGANHKRETIAFSKRRQSAAERLWLLVVWRNHVKSFSERKRDATPAMRAGVSARRYTLKAILAKRLFPGRIALPERWARYYWRHTPTRCLPRVRTHALRYAA